MRRDHRPAAEGRGFPFLFAGGSALAHLLVVTALVAPWPGWTPRTPPQPDTPSTVDVVMVRQPGRTAGRPASAAPAPAAQPAPPLSPSPDGIASARMPPPALPEPAVNLGGDPSDPWSVRSDTVRPPAPDALYRNLPPRYPAEAASRGEFGTVGLVIHVLADGRADGADVVESSGFASLDREARRAVLLWHFTPARRDGDAVPFDYPFAIHFRRD